MMEKILTMLVGLLIALGGWSLSRTFELSTNQAVLEKQVEQLEQISNLSAEEAKAQLIESLKEKAKTEALAISSINPLTLSSIFLKVSISSESFLFAAIQLW